MGRADLATTQIYAKVQQEHLRRVISKLNYLVPVLVSPENVTGDVIPGKEKLNLFISNEMEGANRELAGRQGFEPR